MEPPARTSPPLILAPGQWVSHELRLSRLLAEGGMGSIWVADHTTLGHQVAVKFIRAELLESEVMTERFRREGLVQMAIPSPHVVTTLDQATLPDGTPYIVMELLEGETLRQRWQREGPFGLDDTLVMLGQLAGVLNKAHDRGVVHRDIKPDNIFLLDRERPFIKVLDFGIAKQTVGLLTGLTEGGVTFGTPDFMSPEQLRSFKDVDYRADLWSFAVIAYNAIVGRVPFAADNHAKLCLEICRGSFIKPTDVDPAWPESLDAYFARTFTVNIARRYDSATVSLAGLLDALSSLVEPPPSRLSPLARAELGDDATTIEIRKGAAGQA